MRILTPFCSEALVTIYFHGADEVPYDPEARQLCRGGWVDGSAVRLDVEPYRDPPRGGIWGARGCVRSVYAWAYCKWLPPAEQRAGQTARDLPAEAVPIAVRLGRTDRFEVPRDGESTYPADIRRIFPRDVRDAAFDGSPALDAAIIRVDARVTALLT